MILHAIYADQEFQSTNVEGRIIIMSPDTDVLVLAIHYFPQMSHTKELWIQRGTVTSTSDRRRYIPVHAICKSITPVMCHILPAAHALSGSDTTSAFFGMGKISVFKLLHGRAEEFSDLTTLTGQDEKTAIAAARRCTSALYDPKGRAKEAHRNLNELRIRLASQKDASLIKLPPCEVSFLQHTKRVSWQTKVWMASDTAMQNLGTPLDHGWKREGDGLVPIFYNGPMVSEVLRDLICTCGRKSSCNTNCMCTQQQLPCTELCACGGHEECGNSHTHHSGIQDDD